MLFFRFFFFSGGKIVCDDVFDEMTTFCEKLESMVISYWDRLYRWSVQQVSAVRPRGGLRITERLGQGHWDLKIYTLLAMEESFEMLKGLSTFKIRATFSSNRSVDNQQQYAVKIVCSLC